jgi:pimeloyl-ACP methyl ester carboxylesterase
MKYFLTIIIMSIIVKESFGQPKKIETVKVNGIDIYYEVYGKGEPLLLLHGWTQSSAFWSEYIPRYAQYFKVYAIDLRGHGRSSPVTNDFTIEKSCYDILALLDYLQLKKVNAIGLSYGGLVLLQLGSLQPERIESMILIGTSQKYNGAENSKLGDSFSYKSLPDSFIEELKKIHSHGESQIRALFNPNLNYQIYLRDEEVKAISTRTLIIQGDRDEIFGVDPAILLYRNLPNSELWIVPNTGHIAITDLNLEIFLTKSLQFFTAKKNQEKQMPTKNKLH